MKQQKIVMLAGKGESTNIVYNAMKDEFNIENILIEEPVSKKIFIKKRLKKLGVIKVIGQILFQVFIFTILRGNSKSRIKEILETYNLNTQEIYSEKIINVKSINSDQTISVLKEIKPDVVIVNGTRIISNSVLDAIPVPFVNIHVGITPMYRGVHGAYWAIREQDIENCGVTVHLVDKGIDTGKILEQDIIEVTKKDNFSTYPILQLAKGIPLLKKSVVSILNDSIILRDSPKGISQLRTHPTFFDYLYNRITKGVK